MIYYNNLKPKRLSKSLYDKRGKFSDSNIIVNTFCIIGPSLTKNIRMSKNINGLMIFSEINFKGN